MWVRADYERWLARQALAERTRASYRRWVDEFGGHKEVGGKPDRRPVVDDPTVATT